MNFYRALGIAVLVAAGGMAVSANDAQARDYPFCAQQGGVNGYQNCGYPSFAACRAAVSGVGGFCVENPRYGSRNDRYDDEGYTDEQPRRRAPRY